MFKTEYTGSSTNYHYYGIQSYCIPNPAYGVAGHFAGGYKGVSAYATASGGGNRFGVYAKGLNGSYNVGVYGEGTSYAGDFNGPLRCSGTFTQGSDEKLKEDIKDLEGSIGKINNLKPKKYKFKQNIKLNLPSGDQFGLTAQDLELIYPELVEETKHFVDSGDEVENEYSDEIIEYKSINYIGLIPILIKGIQEQQEMIENLQKRVEQLEKK
jgi:hypothetical protein